MRALLTEHYENTEPDERDWNMIYIQWASVHIVKEGAGGVDGRRRRVKEDGDW